MSIGSNRSTISGGPSGMRGSRESVMSSSSHSNSGVRASVMSSTKVPKATAGADGRIQVAIRCRPLNSKEKTEGSSVIWKFQSQHIFELEDDGEKSTGKTLAYDHVFGPETDTPTLFDGQCKPIVRSALDGYNGTIFAYGQTSSGKTHTLMGKADTHPGVSILSIDEIFDFESKNSHMEWDTYASYIEIYNESVTDLLQRDARKGKNLKIIEDKTLGAIVKDVTELTVLNRQHCLDLILDGEKRRTYAATNMNETSSRSHTLFRLRIEGRTNKNAEKCCDNMRNVASEFLQMQTKLTADHASLYLVDRTTNELFIQAGEITLRLPMSQGIAGAVATTGKTINIADAYEDDRFNRSIDMKTGYRTKSILCMPIQGPDDQCVGVVQFINKMQPGTDGFDNQDETLVSGLTSRLGTLISSAQRNATMSIMSRLNLVDLAGSERSSKTGASGAVLKQAGYINQSLHTLGACIAILSEGKKQHVPFRDSKLTQLLSSSLGGNAKTCLICAISPASTNRSETLSTLQFASRAKQIKNSVQRNCKQDQTELVAVYEAEIAKLKAQLTQGGGGGTGSGGNGRMSIDYTMLEAGAGEGTQLTAQFREKLDKFETNVAEADVLANKSLRDAGYRIVLKPFVASEGGENEDPKLVVAVFCLAQNNDSPKSSMWKPSETWIAEEELTSRLDWLRKQDASGMLLTFAKHGRNAWDSAGAALGSGARLSAPLATEEDTSVLENVMTRDQERKHWQAKNRKLENQLLLLRTYVEHISTEVKRTSQLTKKLHDKKNILTRSSSWSSI